MNRIFFNTTDVSQELRTYRGDAVAFELTTNDEIYFATDRPFNHFYVKFGTVNATPVSFTVEYWDSQQFRPMFETIDHTNGLTEDGYIEFTPDRDYAWVRESDSTDKVPLQSFKVYDKAWLKITITGTIDVGTTLQWVGQMLCDEDDLFGEFSDFARSNFKTAFESGKADWEEQRVLASQRVVEDLQANGIIEFKEQLVDRFFYKSAAVQKTAELIYRQLGDDFVDQKEDARLEYNKRINRRLNRVDKDHDGRLDREEKVHRTGFVTR